MKPRSHVACLVLLCALVTVAHAPRASATEQLQPVKLRPVAGQPVMVPGQPWSGEFELVYAPGVDPADIAGLVLEGRGWDVGRVVPGPPDASGAAGNRVRVDIRRANPGVPLRLSGTWKGQPFERPLGTRGLAGDLPRVRPLQRADAEAATIPAIPGAGTMELPGLPTERTSLDRDGFPRGAVGDRRLGGTTVEPDAESAPGGSTQASRNIRVRGKLIYQFNGQNKFEGADAVLFQIYDEDTGPDELLKEGLTDAAGNFDVTFYWDPCTFCDARPDLYVYFETDNNHVHTQTSGIIESDYSWETGTTADYEGSDLNIGSWRPQNDSESDGALYAHTQITREWRWFSQNSWSLPNIDVQCYETNSSNTPYYNPFFEEIHMVPDRMFVPGTLFHEYGHHWMENFSNSPSPDYCNGICDTNGDCGHCGWCPEKGAVAWSEGFPDFISRHIINVVTATYPSTSTPVGNLDVSAESIQNCFATGNFEDCTKTQGIFAAALWDFVDLPADKDNAISNPNASDNMSLSPLSLIQIADSANPGSTSQFMTSFINLGLANKKSIWQTAYNAGYQLDAAAPGVVTNLTSPTHPIGVNSPNSSPAFTWTEASDDMSGVWGYSISLTGSATMPDTTMDSINTTGRSYNSIPTGTWWFNIRARDRFGRWSASYASYGPFTIRPPDPADLAFPARAGWAAPVVPRAAANATTSSVPAPAALNGNQLATWWNMTGRNIGESATFTNFHDELRVDGDSVAEVFQLGAATDATYEHINQGPIVVKGGRHTLSAFTDAHEVLAEPLETNNTYARQWVWSPYAISPDVTFSRTAPPDRFGGFEDAASSSGFFSNCDGIRFSSSGWWNGFWSYATDLSEDYDLKLHFATGSADTGFAGALGTSQRLTGRLDMVLVNRNTLGNVPWDAGIINFSGGTSVYRARQATSLAFAFGDSQQVGFPALDFAALREVYVSSGNLGPVSVWVRAAPGSAPITVLWLDRTFGAGDVNDYAGRAVTGEDGTARIDLNVTTAGFYGVVVYRDPVEGDATLPFTLQVKRSPADLVPYFASGWHAPLTPRPAADGLFSSVPAPDTLFGNVAQTWLNLAVRNQGATPTVTSAARIGVDGELLYDQVYGVMPAFLVSQYNAPTARTVRGGRHTLSMDLDVNDTVLELDETNNTYGEQWVWSPLPLVFNVPVNRAAPPDRYGGWGFVDTGEALYLNADGFRLQKVTPSGGLNGRIAVALMPHDASDFDLRLHEPAAGTKNAFRTVLAGSAWDQGLSDYVVVNLGATTPRPLDAGAVRWSGTGTYTIEATGSTLRVPDAQHWIGPFTMASGHLLDLHEVTLGAGVWSIYLDDAASAAHLGLSVHGTAPFLGKSGALASTWGETPGGGQWMTLNLAQSATCCFAVWKYGHADRTLTASYRIQIVPQVAGVDDGGATAALALAPPWPNPGRGEVAIAFTLPREGEATVEIFDLQGARVRTLTRGAQAAGRHALAWDGRDDAGRRTFAGLYQVRLRSAGVTLTRKLVRVE